MSSLPWRSSRITLMHQEDRDTKLKRLSVYLRDLPASLPTADTSSRYNFINFSPDPGWIEDIGTVEGAINRELEVRLGTRANGPFEFLERGPAVQELVSVLGHYTQQYPDDTLLSKWLDDALAGAIHTYSKAQVPVSFIWHVACNDRNVNIYYCHTSFQIGEPMARMIPTRNTLL